MPWEYTVTGHRQQLWQYLLPILWTRCPPDGPAFAFLALYLYTRKHENSSLTRNDSVDQDGTSTQSEPVPHVEKLKSSDKWSRIVIVLICVFMHLLIAVEMMFGSFLTTFAVKSDLHLTKVAGAHVTTIFSITWMYGFSCGSLRFVPASFASCSCQPSQFVEPGLDWLTKVVDLVLAGNCASVDQPIQWLPSWLMLYFIFVMCVRRMMRVMHVSRTWM